MHLQLAFRNRLNPVLLHLLSVFSFHSLNVFLEFFELLKTLSAASLAFSSLHLCWMESAATSHFIVGPLPQLAAYLNRIPLKQLVITALTGCCVPFTLLSMLSIGKNLQCHFFGHFLHVKMASSSDKTAAPATSMLISLTAAILYNFKYLLFPGLLLWCFRAVWCSHFLLSYLPLIYM